MAPFDLSRELHVEGLGHAQAWSQGDDGVIAGQALVGEASGVKQRGDADFGGQLADEHQVASNGCHREMPRAGAVSLIEVLLRVDHRTRTHELGSGTQ
ncbi:MAG TPA: hypothetical protein VNS09_01500 [Solirubrobacter sp.]|nr:hypothetical protein [Solirubrobacter sp.]